MPEQLKPSAESPTCLLQAAGPCARSVDSGWAGVAVRAQRGPKTTGRRHSILCHSAPLSILVPDATSAPPDATTTILTQLEVVQRAPPRQRPARTIRASRCPGLREATIGLNERPDLEAPVPGRGSGRPDSSASRTGRGGREGRHDNWTRYARASKHGGKTLSCLGLPG